MFLFSWYTFWRPTCFCSVYLHFEDILFQLIYLPESSLYIGDRVATWMFYMSDVSIHINILQFLHLILLSQTNYKTIVLGEMLNYRTVLVSTSYFSPSAISFGVSAIQHVISRLVKADVQSSLGLELVSNPRLAALSSGNLQNVNNIFQSSKFWLFLPLESKCSRKCVSGTMFDRMAKLTPSPCTELALCSTEQNGVRASFLWSVEEMWRQK